MKSVKKVLCTIFISCFFLFPTSKQISVKGAESIEEGTESVLVVFEYGKENTIPLGEGTKAPQTGDTISVSLYYMISCLSLLVLFLMVYYKEKKKELY